MVGIYVQRLNLLKYNQISAHISSTERKSIKAERQTHYRYLASYMIKFIDQKLQIISIFSAKANTIETELRGTSSNGPFGK